METAAGRIRLTQFSHGAGCGCKISPALLDVILRGSDAKKFPALVTGYESRDDAAVLDNGDGTVLISTTDFFMPIVDDPFDFGRIAAANAISDIYAMGGQPQVALAILGWPIDKIDVSVAARVVEGGKAVCAEAGIPLAGGHSIDCPEPVFGLAVTGKAEKRQIKRNSTAREGDLLFLTKPLGIGILATASKRSLIRNEHLQLAVSLMTALNKIGVLFGKSDSVHAMTDVTGFGLLGHLTEMAEGSGLSAELHLKDIQFMEGLDGYLEQNCVPGGTNRNWKSYSHKISPVNPRIINLLCDPQTSGGLLAAVDPLKVNEFIDIMVSEGLKEFTRPIGIMTAQSKFTIHVY